MRPEYKGTPKFCREPDGVQLGMRAFFPCTCYQVCPSAQRLRLPRVWTLMSGTASSPRIPPDKPSPPPPVSLPSMTPLPQFCPKLACRLTPSFLFFVGFVLTRPVRILLISLAVSPAYIRMNEKRLQREKELLENCELDFLAQKTIPHQQSSTKVPGKMTDVPVLGFLRT